MGVAATDPRATRTFRQTSPSAHQATAITTLEIACARRVPTFRNRTRRPMGKGTTTRRTNSSGWQAVVR